MNPVNYYEASLKMIADLPQSTNKPTLLIHGCCAPCSAFPLEFLVPHFDVTIFFNNSNIYPTKEFDRRLEELTTFVFQFNLAHQTHIRILVPPYEGEAFLKKLAVRKDDKEGHERCRMCYALRMDEGYRYAHEHHFDYFTSVMTISRHKDAQLLNEIGATLSRKYPHTKYFFSDFKKNGGAEKGLQISRNLKLYRQQYCGCLYSYQDYLKRQQAKFVEAQDR